MDVLDAKMRDAIQDLIKQEVARQLAASKPGAVFQPLPRTEPAIDETAVKAALEAMGEDAKSLARSLAYHWKYSTGMAPLVSSQERAYRAAAACVKERMMAKWDATYEYFCKEDPKQVHYLSMEYLLGRLLRNAVGSLDIGGVFGEAVKQLGWDLEAFEAMEHDPGLGNGGLGRLAACFLDSLASLDLPGWGYGIRYKFGLFRQVLDATGRQTEVPEPWLESGNPWEVKRPHVRFPIRFGGKVESGSWKPDHVVMAVAYDMPVPGYRTNNVITLRTWDAEPITASFDMYTFNSCEYSTALADFGLSQKLTAVLYPGDEKREGKALRLMQQYMLSSASVQDIIARYEERAVLKGRAVDWDGLPSKVAIQMNDTHPTMAAPELQRILMDEKGLTWDRAFGIMSKCVAYTNHTLMPEALEQWPLDVMQELLPRHVEIILRVDKEFIAMVKQKYNTWSKASLEHALDNMTVMKDYYRKSRSLSLLPDTGERSYVTEEAPKPRVRMANLCVICGFAVNGVAALHSELCKHRVFVDFYKLWPEKFQNKTNGVTPRRWLAFCNPELAAVITKRLGTDGWIKDATLLKGLEKHAEDPEMHSEWQGAKAARKVILKGYIDSMVKDEVKGPSISDVGAWMFDIQIKRMHEYKRQLLNLLGVVYRYRQYKAMSAAERAKQVPRITIIGGKAFYSYWAAKECVYLTHMIGKVVNNDPDMKDLMRVYFMPNYNVSLAEKLIPAAELSQHISTAGTEASGTSNMKFQMNGCLLIGTLDGANVEIRECVGEENFFLFGTTADKVPGLREERRHGKFTPPKEFLAIKDYIKKGTFGDFEGLMGTLEGNEGFGRADWFLLGYDFDSYIDAQRRVDAMYKDQKKWVRASILSTANSSKFSSDRSISEYAKEMWGLSPLPVP